MKNPESHLPVRGSLLRRILLRRSLFPRRLEDYFMRFRSRLLLTFAALTVAAAGTWLLADRPVEARQTYSMPAPDTVRVIAQKVRNDAQQVEWRWTVITGRHWSGVRTTSFGDFELSGGDNGVRLNAPNIYDLRIRVRSGKDSDEKPRLYTAVAAHQREARASVAAESEPARADAFADGTAPTGGGEEPLKKPVAADKAARAVFTGDKTFPLPLKLPLYERTFGLDGTGKVIKRPVYLIISK
jgi:hypothetical protein